MHLGNFGHCLDYLLGRMHKRTVLLLAAGPEGAADFLRVLLRTIALGFIFSTFGLGFALAAFFSFDLFVFVVGARLDAVENALAFAVRLVLAVGGVEFFSLFQSRLFGL